MSLYTEHRDGTPIARKHWGPLPDPRPVPAPMVRWGFWIRTILSGALVIGCIALMVIGAATLAGA